MKIQPRPTLCYVFVLKVLTAAATAVAATAAAELQMFINSSLHDVSVPERPV